MIFNTGEFYEGDWLKDEAEGQGMKKFVNKDYYLGQI
jgi:hypothetical protein